MSDVTRILAQIDSGDPTAAKQLLPLVYDELRKLAAAKLAHEKPGQTLQATALVHEAYLRLVGGGKGTGDRQQETEDGGQRSELRSQDSGNQNLSPVTWRLTPASFKSRGHFFAAAAEAMRRILVDQARRKQSIKHGGAYRHRPVDQDAMKLATQRDPLLVLAVHEALDRLAQKSPRKSELVKLRYFLGCTLAEAADVLGIAVAAAEEDWTYARAWLRREWLRGQARGENSTP